MSVVKNFLKNTAKKGSFGIGLERRPLVVCKDGFKVSIQASEDHYCSPRENLFNGEYEEVELGYPSEPEELILEYAEEKGDPTDTVYPWTPVEVVEKVLEKHGGIAEPAEFSDTTNTTANTDDDMDEKIRQVILLTMEGKDDEAKKILKDVLKETVIKKMLQRL